MCVTHYMDKLGTVALLLIGLFSQPVFAQEDQWERDGEIKDVEIEIVRERQIVLPRANRNFEKVPPRPAEPIQPEITYAFRNLGFSVPGHQPNLRPLRLKQEEISKIYGNYISAGFGNYSSPYLNAWLNTKRDKNRFLGAHLYHRSFGKGPVDGKNSASGTTDIKLFGETYTQSLTTNVFANYENRGGYFYGYAPGLEVARDTIRQTYNIVSLGGGISNAKPADFNFDLGGRFSYLKDKYEAAESDLSLAFNSHYSFPGGKKVVLVSSYDLIARKDSLADAKPRHLFTVAPSFVFSPMDNLSLTLGATAALENDTIRSKPLHLYPNVSANYVLSQNVNAYASLSGGMEKVTLHSLSQENLWLNANIGIFHTNKAIEFKAGLKGKAGRLLAFQVGAAAANLKDLYFYQNATADRAKFDVVYDRGNTQRINLFGELGYNKNEVVRLNLRGDFFAYSTDGQAEAWHRPTYRLSAGAFFNVYQKLLLSMGVVGQGGMKAFDAQASQVVALGPGFDLNVKADYFLSGHVSVFLKFENILSSDYPLYLNYPVRGFQGMGGLSWGF